MKSPRYDYTLDGKKFANTTREVIKALGLTWDRSHQAFYNYIEQYSDMIYLHWTDWDVQLPQGRLIRILRDAQFHENQKESIKRVRSAVNKKA